VVGEEFSEEEVRKVVKSIVGDKALARMASLWLFCKLAGKC
jgi:hypothetical protein